MLAIWSLVPLPFLNLAWTFGSSWFMYYWSLAWRILSITLLVCEMGELGDNLNILWDCLSLGLNENWLFLVLWPLLSFPNMLVYGMQNFHSIIFQDLKWLNWNSITSTSLLIVMLPKAHLISHSRLSGSRWVIMHHGYLGHEDLFHIVLLYIVATSS